MRKIEAVIFDIDGTILDTREFIFGSYETTLRKFNLPERSRGEIAEQVGHTLDKCYEALAPGAELEPLIKEHRKFQRENYDLITAYDCAIELFEKLKKKSVKVGLWTGRSQTVFDSLVSSGIGPDLYDCVVEAGMYDKSKPDPEGFITTLHELKARPSHSVMVGDSRMDIEAGKRGGTRITIALTHGFGTVDALKQAEPDYIADSLRETSGILQGIGV